MSLGYINALGFSLTDAKSLLTNAAAVVAPGQPQPSSPSGTNYTPWIVGGVVVLVGLALVLRPSQPAKSRAKLSGGGNGEWHVGQEVEYRGGYSTDFGTVIAVDGGRVSVQWKPRKHRSKHDTARDGGVTSVSAGDRDLKARKFYKDYSF